MKIKIANKLFMFFLLVSMVPLAIASFVAYQEVADTLRDMILDRLETLAQERVDRIERLFLEGKDDLTTLVQVPVVADALEGFSRAFSSGGIQSAGYRETEKRYGPLMAALTAKEKIHNLIMISPEGDVVFSLSKERDLGTNLTTGRYRDTALARIYHLVRKGNEAAISAINMYEPSRAAAVFLAAPVKKEDRCVGVLAMQMPMKAINAVAGDYAGLGDTGETSIILARGDDIIWVAPTRHDTGAALIRTLGQGSGFAVPAQAAARGKTGRGVYPDYRGVTVLAAWQHIPSLRLGLVIKMDEAESLAPLHRLAVWFLFLGLGTLLVVLVVSLFIARSMSRPILVLTRAASRVAEGDLAVRTDIRTGDEIGALGGAFNNMAAGLEGNRQASEDDSWVKTGIARLNETMRGDPDIDELSSKVISEVSTYLDAQVGAFYVLSAELRSRNVEGRESHQTGEFLGLSSDLRAHRSSVLRLLGSYAYTKRKNLSNVFKPGEGLVGQAALEKRQILVKNVPEDYVKVTSGLGERVPRFICVTPFLYEGRVKGVVEVGTLEEMTDLQMEYLAQAMSAIAIAVESAQSRTQLSKSLEESQQLSEELQAQQEELKAANEELEAQTQRLTESEERLKAQQEELRVTNEELEEKNDLLERQKREVELARRQIEEKAAEVALASKYKSEFLANMSHELRTPLNSLLLLAQGLAQNKEGNLTAEQVESARIVYGSGSDLLNLINEILDLSKIEAGRMELQLTPVQVSNLAERVRGSFGHMCDGKGLSLEVTVRDDAPVEITSDPHRVEQVIRNLVSNAVKFTEQGGVTVTFGQLSLVNGHWKDDTGKTVTLRAAADPSEIGNRKSQIANPKFLYIAVRDTGMGIAPEQQKIIFEAFQQADGKTSRKYGGTGLGLSISRELARLLGGEIQLESEPGKGSTFILYLPVEAGSRRLETRNSKPEIHKKAFSNGQHQASSIKSPVSISDDRDSIIDGDRVILVIEDDPNFARILFDKCHEKGFKCVAAPTGEIGLKLAAKHLPSAVILDIRLPGMDGWAVLQALKEDTHTRHIPVHVVSVEPASTESLRKGAVGHAVKPVSQEDLEETFRRLDQVSAGKPRRILVVEDDPKIRRETVRLIGNGDVRVDEAGTGADALKALRANRYRCMVLDLGLPDMDGNELLATIEHEGLEMPPVIVHTARDLTYDQEMALRKHAESIVIKDVRSQERLLDEVSLFLHRMVSQMPDKKRKMIQDLYDTDELLRDKKVLVVDDDMRTMFAVSRLLSERGMNPLKAENGERALSLLDEQPDVALVLMDIMMPVMDGYESMERIRAQERFKKLPIIALTAKAMPEDREKCLAAGANDYLPKPVDAGRLISMMRVWLYR